MNNQVGIKHVGLFYSHDQHEHHISDRFPGNNHTEKAVNSVSAQVFGQEPVQEVRDDPKLPISNHLHQQREQEIHRYITPEEIALKQNEAAKEQHEFLIFDDESPIQTSYEGPEDLEKSSYQGANIIENALQAQVQAEPKKKEEPLRLYKETSPQFEVSRVHIPIPPSTIQKIVSQYELIFSPHSKMEENEIDALLKAIQTWDDARSAFEVNQEDYVLISTQKGEFVVSPKGELMTDTGKAIEAGSFHKVKFYKSEESQGNPAITKAFRVDLAVRPKGTFIPASVAESTIPFVGAGSTGIQRHIVRVWSTNEKTFKGTITHGYNFGDLENAISKKLIADLVSPKGHPEEEREQALTEAYQDGFKQLLTGLATTENRGVVHNDIKPKNILVERDREGNLKFNLADWDEARFAHIPLMETDQNINFSIVYRNDIKTIVAKSKEVQALKTAVLNLEGEVHALQNDASQTETLAIKKKELEEAEVQLKKVEQILGKLGHKRDCMSLALSMIYMFTNGEVNEPLGDIPVPENYNPQILLGILAQFKVKPSISQLLVSMLDTDMNKRPLPHEAFTTLQKALAV